MCGIVGLNDRDPEQLARMAAAVSHRGPDAIGSYIDDAISLGHTLLAIRGEPDRSRQPVVEGSSPWVLAFNGQIYNTDALKERFLGDDWRDEDLDTLILYALIQRCGWDFIRHIAGMFAIALWNRTERTLRLYRDPSGQKPCYYYFKGGRLVFGSELKAILTQPDLDRSLDVEALTIACRLGYVPGPKTLFQHIKKVELAQCITYQAPTRSLAASFFAGEPGPAPTRDDDPHAFLHGVIRDHLKSRRTVALNLSGGLDSSLILHEASQAGHRVETYTTSFADSPPALNEDADVAQQLARAYGTAHTEIRITAQQYLDAFVDAYRLIEEPNYNISLPVYLLTARHQGISGDGNRVVLTGDGGDETFGGYPYYGRNRQLDRLRRRLSPLVFDMLLSVRHRQKITTHSPPGRWLYFRDFRRTSLRKAPSFDLGEYLDTTAAPYFRLYAQPKDSMYGTMVMDRVTWLASENFVRSDKLYMSQSVEVRAPLGYEPCREYFDRRLGATDYLSGASTKVFLRAMYTGKLPDRVARKTKTGWRAPIAAWYGKEAQRLFVDIVDGNPFCQGDIIDWPAIKQLLKETPTWPGKKMHLYLSIAILCREFGVAT